MSERECNFVNSNQAKRSLDPWCTSHERSAICCMRELREELATLRARGCGGALATLARVEGLPPKWRQLDRAWPPNAVAYDCADELEATLKGKP
jgi:hypothetical protein